LRAVPANGRGAERQAEKLGQELIRLGQRVTVLTLWLDRSTPRVEDAGLIIHRFPWLNLSRLLPGVPGLGRPNLLAGCLQLGAVLRWYLGEAYIVHAHIVPPLAVFAPQVARWWVPVICKVASAGD
jgi:hypothetical protein